MTEKKRIHVMFLLPSLRGGGAERVTVHLLAGLDRSRFSPTLILAQREGPYLKDVPDDVEVIDLHRSRMRYTLLDLVRILRTRQPDILFSAMRHVNTVAILAKLLSRSSTRFVASEHSVLPTSIQNRRQKTLREFMLKILYPLSDQVVAVSNGVASDLITSLSLAPDKVTTIYNPVVDSSLEDLKNEPVEHPWFAADRAVPVILGCGRLTNQKGFAYLIKAVARIQDQIPARLVILGKGPLQAALNRLIHSLGLTDRIQLLGFQPNPYKFMARADLFVLSSLWEGLGLALIEAMACGAPVISTDCPSGPGEIITHGVNGLLVPPGDVEALSAAIRKVLSDQESADQLSREGQHRAKDFRICTSIRKYQELFLEVLGKNDQPS
ncbi:MAG: glycosyltransferase [Chloroflexota bacterium]|nr:glycosyltransferase [Chloroflexota bacterium]